MEHDYELKYLVSIAESDQHGLVKVKQAESRLRSLRKSVENIRDRKSERQAKRHNQYLLDSLNVMKRVAKRRLKACQNEHQRKLAQAEQDKTRMRQEHSVEITAHEIEINKLAQERDTLKADLAEANKANTRMQHEHSIPNITRATEVIALRQEGISIQEKLQKAYDANIRALELLQDAKSNQANTRKTLASSGS